jgi:phosphoribosyl-AMP cyclohydrolase
MKKVMVLSYITQDNTTRRILAGVYSNKKKLEEELSVLRSRLGNFLYDYEVETFILDELPRR